MRLLSLFVVLSLTLAGCSGAGNNSDSDNSGSSTSQGGSESGSSASGSSGGSSHASSSKASRDPLIWENRHLNDWLKDVDSKQDRERSAAATVLGEIGARAPGELSRIVPALATLAKDTSPRVRRAAAASLTMVGPSIKEAIPALGSLLHDKDQDVRANALKALTNAGPDAAPALEDLKFVLADRDSKSLRAGALAVIRQIKVEPQTILPALKIAMSDSDRSVGDEAVKLTVALGEPALPDLIAWLRDPNEVLNRRAAEALAMFKEKAKPAIPDLTKALNDADRKLRTRAAEALAAIGDPDTIPALMDKLDDEDTCASAATAIIAILDKSGARPKQAINPLIAIVREGKPTSKHAAARVLVKFDKDAAVPLADLMTVNDAAVLEEVSIALGAIGPAAREVLDRLFVLLQDNDSVVSDGATKAIRRIGLTEDMIPKLVTVAMNETGFGRYNAALLLTDEKLRKTGIPKLAALLEAKGSDALSPKAIEDILGALGKTSPPSDAKPAVDAIVKLLTDEDEDVQNAAKKALKKIDPDTAKKNGVK